MPVTSVAPGSRTANGGNRVRSGPVSQPSSAAPKIPQPTTKAARVGSRVLSNCRARARRANTATTSPARAAATTLGQAGWRMRVIPTETSNQPG